MGIQSLVAVTSCHLFFPLPRVSEREWSPGQEAKSLPASTQQVSKKYLTDLYDRIVTAGVLIHKHVYKAGLWVDTSIHTHDYRPIYAVEHLSIAFRILGLGGGTHL